MQPTNKEELAPFGLSDRVCWQTLRTHFEMEPLASSIG